VSERTEVGGHHRVAAFLLSLDRDVAANILKSLNEDVVVAVSQAMLELDPKLGTETAVNDIYRSIAVDLNGPQDVRACDDDELREILVTTFGKPGGESVHQRILENRRTERPFLNVEKYPAGVIFRVLKYESSSAVSLVLSHLDPALAAQIIKLCEEEKALEIVGKMAVLSPPGLAMLQTIADNLEQELALSAEEPAEPDPSDRLRSVAQLLNFTTPEIEKSVIESLAEEDSEMAAELREYLFTWDDIAEIDKRSMQKILGSVDTKTLSIALKACTPAVEENVMGNLSQRVREMVAEERELAGAMPISEVQASRDEIMMNIRAMIEAGEFSPSRGGEDLVS
jgi:flagellar motor switch protein FliG